MIFSDVDGVYTADPRDCPDACHMPQIDYNFMASMSQAGAKVLNARAVETARSSGIVVEACKTGEPSARHTLLVPKVETQLWAVVGHRQLLASDDMQWPQIGVGNKDRYVDMTDANVNTQQKRLGLVTPLFANHTLAYDLLAEHLMRADIHIMDTLNSTFGRGFVLDRNDVSKGVCILHDQLRAQDTV
jgi:aspartokinase